MTRLMILDQFVNIVLYSWTTLILIRKVFCKGFDIRHFAIRSSFKRLLIRSYYYSDILFLTACLIALCAMVNQFNSYMVGDTNYINRPVYWIIFHKVLTISYIVRNRGALPKIMIDMGEDIKKLFSKK